MLRVALCLDLLDLAVSRASYPMQARRFNGRMRMRSLVASALDQCLQRAASFSIRLSPVRRRRSCCLHGCCISSSFGCSRLAITAALSAAAVRQFLP